MSVAGLGHTADGLYGAFGEVVAQQHPHDEAAGSGGRFTGGEEHGSKGTGVDQAAGSYDKLAAH